MTYTHNTASEGTGDLPTTLYKKLAWRILPLASICYAVAIIELDEGTRMMANIVNSDVEAVAIGARVKVCFERASDEITLPQFELFN